MVDNNDLSFFVLVVVELGDVLISFDVRSWEIQGFFNMILLILVGFSEVDEQEISLETDWQLLSFDGHRSKVGGLAACVFFRFIPFVDRFDFLLLVY